MRSWQGQCIYLGKDKNIHMTQDNFKIFKIVVAACIAIDVLIWFLILFPANTGALQFYFLDVGQGDSSLILLPGGPKMLIDGGKPNGRLQENLESILSPNDRYIDLVMVSHPQLDHFGGFVELLRNYKVGAVLMSKHGSEQAAWQELELVVKEQHIPKIVLRAGDTITYRDSHFDILSPRDSDWASDINDLSVVTILTSSGVKAFFGGDISDDKERQLANLYDVNVDILKVSHHGSQRSSDPEFLREVSPMISVVEVGKNSYGHPTSHALGRLANMSSQVYRTDLDGLMKLVVKDGKLKVLSAK